MDRTNMNTAKTCPHKWCLVDADGKVLGRMATRIATVLQGKHRPDYVPYMDTGDHVIVVNADKVVMTGKKLENKVYRHHTGYVGHLVEISAKKMMEENPEEVVRLAVRRMLPKSKLGQKMFGKLRVFRGPDHPHIAQNPEPMEI